jgi:hypothetical protein
MIWLHGDFFMAGLTWLGAVYFYVVLERERRCIVVLYVILSYKALLTLLRSSFEGNTYSISQLEYKT